MDRLTADTITDSQIRTLAQEAGSAGDMVQSALCELALTGDIGAREACAQAVNVARGAASE